MATHQVPDPPALALPAVPARGHHVIYYAGDFPSDLVAEHFREGAMGGAHGLMVSTRAHWDDVQGQLGDEAQHVDFVDAEATLARLLVDGKVSHERFTRIVGAALDKASRNGARPVHAFGELVVLLCARGLPDAALDLERQWNRFLRSRDARLLCAYPLEVVPTTLRSRIDAQHEHA